MDYRRIYDAFIEDRRSHPPTLSYDRHHVLPKSLGGAHGDVVLLSFADHLFAHLLLAKIHGGRMATAAVLMLNRAQGMRGKAARKRYAWVRREHRQFMAAAQSERMKNKALRERTSAALLGRPKAAEAIAKRTKTRALNPVRMSEQAKSKLRERQLGTTAGEVTKAKMAAAMKGYVKTESHREALRQAALNDWAKGTRPRTKRV